MIPQYNKTFLWMTAPLAMVSSVFGEEEVDETKAGYEELIAGQGDTAYAFQTESFSYDSFQAR